MCSGLFFTAVSALYGILQSWRDVGVSILGQRLSLNMIDLLHLRPLFDLLATLAGLGVFGILLGALALAAALGVVLALAMGLVGILYNLSGRMEIEVAEK